jgi:hypothetical protein
VILGGSSDQPETLNHPTAAVEVGGHVFVVDHRRVHRFSIDGRARGHLGLTELDGPRDIDARDGEIAVADARRHAVLVFDTRGRLRRTVGSGRLNAPRAVALHDDGMWVADADGVHGFDASGRWRADVRTGGRGGQSAVALRAGARGETWILDPAGRQLVVVDAGGRPITTAPAASQARLLARAPNGVMHLSTV